MSNPLLVFWSQLFGRRRSGAPIAARALVEPAAQASSTIFVIMRRMRAPLITLIVIFTISVIGLTLIPGFDADFTPAQRLWVTFSIYLTVVGWAYAIGSMLALLQDQAFRQALALRQFTRRVTRMSEPFLLVAGYGRAGELLAKSFDALGQQLVVIDESSERIDALDLGAYHAEIPGLAADAANPQNLIAAGIANPHCSAVLALTNDDQVNLAVTMAAALLRPELPVVARTISPTIAERMRAFGSPAVVNPFDRFGEHLRLALNSPSSYQLLTWLEGGPGAELPERGNPRRDGRWIVCGYGRFGREVTNDLRAAGLDVTIIEPAAAGLAEPGVIAGDASDPDVLARADLATAIGMVAGTDNDTTNLSMLANARRVNPELFLAARQNRPTSSPLFQAMHVDALLVPTEVVAHEVYAQVSTPMLWRFIQEMPARGDAWAGELIERLRINCGRELPALWKIRLDRDQAPALSAWLADRPVSLGELLRSPEDRDRRLRVVPLLLMRDGEVVLAPVDETLLCPDDQLLFAGHGSERRELEGTLVVEAALTYVLCGRRIPQGWVWRKLTRAQTGAPPGPG